MSLFQTPSDKPSFFVPEPKSYIGELVTIEKFERGKFGPSTKWVWALYDIATGEPVLFNETIAKVDALSTTNLGPGSKSRKWFDKHLAPHRQVVEGEDPDQLVEEVIGKRVRLTFVLSEDEDGKEKVVLSSQGGVLAYAG